MKIEIRLDIGVAMCNCAARKKWKQSVPELQSKMRSGCGMQFFEKAQCFYVATVNFNVFVYYRVT